MNIGLAAICVGLIALAATLSSANAATLNVISGLLRGASDVTVGSSIYSVEFVDGTCAGVFGTCQVSGFNFTTPADAAAASQALLDQVLIGAFDTNPSSTFGCQGEAQCWINTPYGTDSSSGWVFSYQARNASVTDGLGTSSSHPTLFDTSNSSYFTVWAKWTPTPVPLPPALGLFAAGLAGLGWARRRQAKASTG